MAATDVEVPQNPANLKCRTRSESEDSVDSDVRLTARTEDEVGQETVCNDASHKNRKTSKNRPKKLKSEKCDKENDQISSPPENVQERQKDVVQTKKRSKTVIKSLEDVANLLLGSDRRKIAIPVKLIEKLIFFPNFSREKSLEAAQESLHRLIQGLDNIRGALILDSEQARHLDRVKTMIDTSNPDTFSALVEMKSDQQVDVGVAKLARTSGSNPVIKLARLLKEEIFEAEHPKQAVDQPSELGRQRSNTISSSTQAPPKPNKPMPKRHSLGGNFDRIALPSASSPVPLGAGRAGQSNGSLIRLPFGPGSDGFRPEARMRL